MKITNEFNTEQVVILGFRGFFENTEYEIKVALYINGVELLGMRTMPGMIVSMQNNS